MGFFSSLVDIAKDANEVAHGQRLLNEVQSTFAFLENQDPKVQYVSMAGYIQIRERLQNEMVNISHDGRIKLGRTMQTQAREQFDIDISGANAKWLAGAWLESQERSSLNSQQAFSLLEGFATYIQNDILSS